MYVENFHSPEAKIIDCRCKALCQELLKEVPSHEEGLKFDYIENLYSKDRDQHLCYLIQTGVIAYEHNASPLFFFDEGDLIGLDQDQLFFPSRYYSESAIELTAYTKKSILDTLTGSDRLLQTWTEFLVMDSYRRTAIISMFRKAIDKGALGFAYYKPGDVIIEEGSDSETVYSIIEGHAQVTVNGVQVGEVLEDEIFGALSLLTSSRRTATVTATSRCMVMVVPKNEFVTLLQTHPTICMNLMENMARKIVSLNDQITTDNDFINDSNND